ncbi:hypothetical protein [Shouchella clausii]|uniref:hypothetical protein n=1 Tax=Shouchella clausii TaxID=79880 RepID=UPI000BA56BA0|nr:hypothetical protein [Shouchella clausii]PAD93583.1 hypothetical protein CHH52_03890 [Shouchella clausii]
MNSPTRLSPKEEDELIRTIISSGLNEHHFDSLARTIDEYPQNIYPKSSNNEDKANIIVTRANQKEKCHLIKSELSSFFSIQSNNLYPKTLDNQIALSFGKLYEDLLRAIESEDIGHLEEFIHQDKIIENKDNHTEFKVKLEKKAQFTESTRELAFIHKNDNSVMQRKAKKLGYKSYSNMEIKVGQLYQSVLTEYPVGQYPAERRLRELLHKLYSFLPEKHQDKVDTTDYLYGIIFGTASRCLIFNE